MPGIDLTVLFAQIPSERIQGAGFGVAFQWDIPLLEGYKYDLLTNVAQTPSVTSFRGCDTPNIHDKLKHLRPDLVVINGWVVKTCLQALFSSKRLSIPTAVRGEANLLRPRAFWKRLIQRFLVRRFDYALPIGIANRRFYESLGISNQRMFSSPYCIENDRFQQASDGARMQRNSLRQNWNIKENAFCLLFCGKFESKKHPIELVHAFQESYQSNRNLHLLMVGDGELRTTCQQYAMEHDLPITFTGFLNQSKIVDAYAAADVLVVPSDHGETWGLVVNEAMACGVPAIVSNLVGCREDLILEDKTGWSFEFGRWNQFVDILLKVAETPDKLPKMQENCRIQIGKYTPAHAAVGIATAAQTAIQKYGTGVRN
jgi:glycosyltransferase involved in cell wall biosynthesis